MQQDLVGKVQKMNSVSQINDKWQYKKMKQFTSVDLAPSHKGLFTRFFMVLVALAPLMGSAAAQEAGKQNEQAAAPANAQADTPIGVAPEAVAALEKRVKNLEREITDLRTMIGTFASMGRAGNGSAGNGSAGNRDGAPLSEFGAPASGPRSSNLPWQGEGRTGIAPSQQGMSGQQGRDGQRREGTNFEGAQSALSPSPKLSPPPQRPNIREDGAVSDHLVAKGPDGSSALQDNETTSDPVKKASVAPIRVPENGDAQSLYKDAYAHMLRRDYASAQSAFGALIKNHPQSRMAGNAQYWLGETYYVRGKYRPAADAFLKAYRNYSNGIKAPDSLMKLAFSLSRLGQKGAACKTFDELNLKYPNAPNHVKQRAGMEQRRTGCN